MQTAELNSYTTSCVRSLLSAANGYATRTRYDEQRTTYHIRRVHASTTCEDAMYNTQHLLSEIRHATYACRVRHTACNVQRCACTGEAEGRTLCRVRCPAPHNRTKRRDCAMWYPLRSSRQHVPKLSTPNTHRSVSTCRPGATWQSGSIPRARLGALRVLHDTNASHSPKLNDAYVACAIVGACTSGRGPL